jgi:hypothetical protein
MAHHPHRSGKAPNRDVQGLWLPDGMGTILTNATKDAAVLIMEFKQNNGEPFPADAPETAAKIAPVQTLVEKVMQNTTQYRVIMMDALTNGMHDIFTQMSNGPDARKTDILMNPDQIARGQEALSALSAARLALLAVETDIPEKERTPQTRKVAIISAFAGKVAREISEARKTGLTKKGDEPISDTFQNLGNESSLMQMAVAAQVKQALESGDPVKALNDAIEDRQKTMDESDVSKGNMKIMIRTLELTRKITEQMLKPPEQRIG